MKLLSLPQGRTRGDCIDGTRPCPFACRHRLDDGACVLDIVDERGAMTLVEVGEVFGVTRERIRQIEAKALASLAKRVTQIGIER